MSKRLVIIVVSLILVALLTFLWYKTVTKNDPLYFSQPETLATTSERSLNREEATPTSTTATDNSDQSPDLAPSGQAEIAFTITVSTLPPLQQQALRIFGVEAEELVVSKKVLACIEARIGAEEMDAIRQGGSPSLSAGVAIVGCYTAN